MSRYTLIVSQTVSNIKGACVSVGRCVKRGVCGGGVCVAEGRIKIEK